MHEDPSADPLRIEDEMASFAWLRRLAVAIVHDADVADDLAQEALLMAHRRRGDAEPKEPGWFARVIKNLAFSKLRADARRKDRERRNHELSARSLRAAEEPDAALVRLEVQEDLLRAVRNLPEPYRSTVLLRWFEGLAPTEVARRTSVPLRTVHTRTTRALALLRDDLDRRSRGDRSRWVTACLPFFTSPKSLPWIVLMKVNLKTAVVASILVLALSGAGILWLSPSPAPADPMTQVAAIGPDAPLSAPARSTLEAPREERVPLVIAPPATAATKTAQVDTADVTDRVIDAAGAPVANLVIELTTHDAADPFNGARATSDRDGRFMLPSAKSGGAIRPLGDHWVALYEPHLKQPDPAEGYVLVVCEKRLLRGRVVDASHAPVKGAEIRLQPVSGKDPIVAEESGKGTQSKSQGSGQASRALERAESDTQLHNFGNGWVSFDPLRAELGVTTDASILHAWRVNSDDLGNFQFSDAPAIAVSQLFVRATGFSSTLVRVLRDEDDVLVVLQVDTSAPQWLEGRVVGEHGEPLAEATVAQGSRLWRTGRFGEFRLDLRPRETETRLIVTKCGWKPAVMHPNGSAKERTSWPDPLVIQLSEEPTSTIQGRVVDASARPVPGASVTILDPVSFNELLSSLGEEETTLPGAVVRKFDSVVEADDEGRFTIGCALPRSFRLQVFDVESLECTVTDPIFPGATDVTVQLGRGPKGRLRGVVVDPRGVPIAGARVFVQRVLPGSPPDARVCTSRTPATTDDKGRFELSNVSPDVREVGIQVEQAAPGVTRAVDPKSGADVRLVAGRMGHISVRIVHPEMNADRIAVLAADGRALQIFKQRGGGGSIGGDSAPLEDGRTEPMVLSEEAVTLVLSRNGREVKRIAIHVEPGKLLALEI